MRFVIKTIFFLAVVAAFIPRQSEGGPAPAAAPDSAPAASEAINVTDEAREAAGDFCARKPALCQTAEESLHAARFVGQLAMSQVRKAVSAAAEPEAAAPATDAPAP